MPADTQLIRLLRMQQKLTTAGKMYSLRELADFFDVSVDTAQRDIDKLSGIYNVVEETGVRNTSLYRIEGSTTELGPIRFDYVEAVTLRAALSSMYASAPVSPPVELRQIVGKLDLLLKDADRSLAGDLASVFIPQDRDYIPLAATQHALKTLISAISSRQLCRFQYTAAHAEAAQERTVRPLRLVSHQGALYLMAAPVDADDVRSYALQRIDEISMLEDAFTDSLAELVDARLQSAFGIFVADEPEDVVIEFNSFIAKKVQERVFHPNEVKEVREDGGITYRLRCGSQWEIIPWVLSYGPWAELVRPLAWRKAIAERVAATHALYDRDS